MRESIRRRSFRGAARLGALVLVLWASGCVHYDLQPAHRTTVVHAGPPPWAPAHGFRQHHAEAWLVYDSALACYAVDGYPDHYFHRDAFYRHRHGRWERAGSLRGGWTAVGVERVPAPLGRRYARASRQLERERRDLRREERRLDRRSRELEKRRERLLEERERRDRQQARQREQDRKRHERSVARARRRPEPRDARLERKGAGRVDPARTARHERREARGRHDEEARVRHDEEGRGRARAVGGPW